MRASKEKEPSSMKEKNHRYYPSADLLIEALNFSPLGVAIIDPSKEERPIVYVNKGFSTLTGYLKEEIIGKNSRFLHGMDTAAAVVTKMDEAIVNEKEVTLEIVNYRKNGEKFWSELHLHPVYAKDEDKQYYIAIQSDITDQKLKDEKLKAYDKEIQSLSTPIVPLVDQVFALPIVGTVDDERLQQIFDEVTEAVYSSNIKTLILDLSGLNYLSDDIIRGLFTLYELMELLDSELIITGISEELAAKTREIDLDLNNFRTFSTIKEAITHKQQI